MDNTDLAALERVIDDHPDDEQNFLVYADALQQRGDRRGELIALQHATGRDAKRAAREHALREELGIEYGKPAWRLGFIDQLEIGPTDLFRLADVLDHPACRFLRELVVWASYDDAHAALVAIAARERPTLRSLRVVQFYIDNTSVRWRELKHRHRDADAIWKALPRLLRADINGWDLFYEIAHPTLTTLILGGTPMCEQESLTWDLPALQLVEWSLRVDATGATVDVDPVSQLSHLWESALPALQYLDVSDVNMAANVTTPIFEVPGFRNRLPQLSVVRLPAEAIAAAEDGRATAAALSRQLLANAALLGHLAELGLGVPRAITSKQRRALRDRLHVQIPGFRWLDGRSVRSG